MKIGFLGAGNMAGAMIHGALAAGVAAGDIYVSDPDAQKLAAFEALGMHATADNAALVAAVDCIILCVKPQILQKALPALAFAAGKIVVSIVTGWGSDQMAADLPAGARYLRVMPNTPALVGEGVMALSRQNTLRDAEKAELFALFSAMGMAVWVDEGQMTAVTAVSGAGPAYVYCFIEAMADAAVALGIPRAQAYQMVGQTVKGAAALALEGGKHPAQLKDEVCSPGGVTIKGMAALEQNGFRGAVITAVETAAQKAEALVRKTTDREGKA